MIFELGIDVPAPGLCLIELVHQLPVLSVFFFQSIHFPLELERLIEGLVEAFDDFLCLFFCVVHGCEGMVMCMMYQTGEPLFFLGKHKLMAHHYINQDHIDEHWG